VRWRKGDDRRNSFSGFALVAAFSRGGCKLERMDAAENIGFAVDAGLARSAGGRFSE